MYPLEAQEGGGASSVQHSQTDREIQQRWVKVGTETKPLDYEHCRRAMTLPGERS